MVDITNSLIYVDAWDCSNDKFEWKNDFFALNDILNRVFLDIPVSPAKIAVPPDGCKMTDKLGTSSAPPVKSPSWRSICWRYQ
jgi:hypothetical protein